MATEVETLLVRMQADVAKYQQDMARMVTTTEARTRAVERRFAETNAAVKQHMTSMSGILSAGTSALAGALSVKTVADYADAWQSAVNKIKATSLDSLGTSAAMSTVTGIADRARTDFASTADLYARLSRASRDVGASQAEVAIATEVVAKSLRITGASASETESTLIQLGQALTSGKLQGDELRSLSENAPVIAASIARAFGVTIGELKTLGAEGKLTSDRVFRAIIDAAPEVERAFATTTATISESFKRLETAAIKFVGTSNTMSGTSALVSAALGGLANNFDTVAAGALALGAIIASRLVAGGLTAAVAGLSSATAASAAASAGLNVYSAAAARAGAASSAAAIASRVFGASLALVGGVPGAIVLGLVSALGYAASKSAEASAQAQIYASALGTVEGAANKAAPAVQSVARAVDETSRAMAQTKTDILTRDFDQADTQARKLESALTGLITYIGQFSSARVSNGEKEAALAAIKSALEGDAQAAQAAKATIDDLGKVNPSFAAAFAQFSALLGQLAAVRASAAAARAALAGVGEAQAAADEKSMLARIPNPTAGTTYQQDVDQTRRDPVMRTLIGQGEARRAVIDAEMDETARKYRDKETELRERIIKAGGIAPDNIQAQARAIVDAEEAGKGGGGKKAKAAKDNDLQTETKAIEDKIIAMAREAEGLGLTALEKAKYEAQTRLTDAAEQAGLPLTAARRAEIDRLAMAYAETTVQLEQAKNAQAAYRDLQQFVGSSLTGFFSDIVSGGKNASDALMNLTKKLAEAALQAALLGQGPLASLLGSKDSGGLLGLLMGGAKLALGGVGPIPGLAVGTSYVPRDMPAVVHRGEMIIPRYDADLIRKGGAGGGGGAMAITIDVRGATGNEEIRRMVAAGMSQAVVAAEKRVARNVGSMLHSADMRYL